MEKVKCSTNVTPDDTPITMTNMAGKLALHDCVERGDLDMLTRLLDDGWLPINGRDKYGCTPLCIGAQLGHTEIARVLISYGADVILKDNTDRTPLHKSALSGNYETVKLLIQHEGDVNAKDNNGETPLHISARQGDKEIVKLLIQHGADIDAVDKWNCTPLSAAKLHGHSDIAYFLRQATPVQAAHRKFLSSIHDVSTNRSRSEKVNCSTNATPRDTSIPLMDKGGKLTLQDCVRRGDLDMLTCLLDDNWPVDQRDEDGWTPLCIGTWLCHTEIVKTLIRNGADVNVKDNCGWTPLHYMAYQGHKEMGKVLISLGADVNAEDNDGETPLYRSTCQGHTEMVELLISHGADVNVKDKNGVALLHSCGHQDDKEILKALIICGADVNVTDENGQTLLHKSGKDKDKEIAEVLISHGADVNIKDYYGNTPLHTNVWSHNKETVKLLIQNGADIDAVDKQGRTPLMVAETVGDNDIVDIIKQAKYPGRQIKKVMAGFFGYSSRTRKVTVQGLDDKSRMTKVNSESSEIRKKVTESFKTFESVSDGEVNTVTEGKASQSQMLQDKSNLGLQRATEASPVTETTTSSAATPSATVNTSATEIRHRLESQAGYMEKMVQSCVAGGGVGQDQSSDRDPLHHGGVQVPVNFNFIIQPKNVEVFSTKQVNCTKAEVERAEMMPVNSQVTINYPTRPSSDNEDNEDSIEDSSSDIDNEIHIEDARK